MKGRGLVDVLTQLNPPHKLVDTAGFFCIACSLATPTLWDFTCSETIALKYLSNSKVLKMNELMLISKQLGEQLGLTGGHFGVCTNLVSSQMTKSS